MLVRDAMTRRVETIGPDEALQAAARKMRELAIGALPVCEGDRLVGMLTDRDIVVRSTAEGQDAATAQVRSSMIPQVIYCFEEEPLHNAARLTGTSARGAPRGSDQANRSEMGAGSTA